MSEAVVYRANDPRERERWDLAWGRSIACSPYAHSSFVQAYAAEGQAVAIHLTAPAGEILYPTIVRSLPNVAEPVCDLTGPYGYGGPQLISVVDPDELRSEFRRAMATFCKESRVVSEFTRLSLRAGEASLFHGEIEERQPNVVWSLDRSEENLWSELDYKVRKNVTRARKEGVRIVFDDSGIDHFYEIYIGTMRRSGASAQHYLERSWFVALMAALPGITTLAFAERGGERISTELLLIGKHEIFSFLGGTAESAFALRPNDLLKWEVALWARSRGLSRYVLGGGLAADDGIFRYKKAFCPNGVVPFRIGHVIHNRELYSSLSAESRARAVLANAQINESFFPLYRAF